MNIEIILFCNTSSLLTVKVVSLKLIDHQMSTEGASSKTFNNYKNRLTKAKKL